jgi:hypothetical protein
MRIQCLNNHMENLVVIAGGDDGTSDEDALSQQGI